MFTRPHAHERHRPAGVAIRGFVRKTGHMSEFAQPPDAHVLAGLLGDEPTTRPEQVAARLHVSADVAERCLLALERDGIVQRTLDGAWRPRALDPGELRELYPAVAILESLALRQSPRFESPALAELRAVNARLRAASGDAPAAITADYDFHEVLTRDCGNPGLLEVLRSIKRALVPYERAYMLDAARIERSASQHDAIIAALEADDRERAATLVRDNFVTSLPDVASQFDDAGSN
jgi:DNA-binding GntR family transcriptional regulator